MDGQTAREDDITRYYYNTLSSNRDLTVVVVSRKRSVYRVRYIMCVFISRSMDSTENREQYYIIIISLVYHNIPLWPAVGRCAHASVVGPPMSRVCYAHKRANSPSAKTHYPAADRAATVLTVVESDQFQRLSGAYAAPL